MKHLNFLSNLMGLSKGSQSSDVGFDRRLTVGSPSGRYCSGLMRLVFILAILLTVGIGNAWGAVTTVTLPFEWTVATNNSSAISYPTGVSQHECGTYSSNYPYRIKFDTQGDYILINLDAAADKVYFNVKMVGGTTTSKFKVQGCATSDGSYSDVQEFTISGNSNSTVVNCTTSVSINSSYRFIKIIKSEHGSNVGFGYLKITKATPATPYTVRFYKTDGTYQDLTEASAAAGVTPPTMQATCGDWSFQGWSTSYSNSTTSTTVLNTVTLTTGKYYPAANTTLYPVYTKSGGTAFSQYQLITSASGDLSGKYLLSTGSITATGAVPSSQALPYESLTPGTTQYAAKEFTVVKNGNNSNYFIKFPNGQYLGNKNGSADLKTNGSTTAPTDNVNHFLWTFTTSEISNVNNSTKDLKYNNDAQTPIIKCYAHTGNSYPKLKLYKRIETEITYYYSYPSCCTSLASINGSFFWTPLFEPFSPDNSWLKTHMERLPYFIGPISYPAPPYIYCVYIP